MRTFFLKGGGFVKQSCFAKFPGEIAFLFPFLKLPLREKIHIQIRWGFVNWLLAHSHAPRKSMIMANYNDE